MYIKATVPPIRRTELHPSLAGIVLRALAFCGLPLCFCKSEACEISPARMESLEKSIERVMLGYRYDACLSIWSAYMQNKRCIHPVYILMILAGFVVMGGCQLLAAEKKDEKDDCAWLLGLDLSDLSVCSMHILDALLWSSMIFYAS